MYVYDVNFLNACFIKSIFSLSSSTRERVARGRSKKKWAKPSLSKSSNPRNSHLSSSSSCSSVFTTRGISISTVSASAKILRFIQFSTVLFKRSASESAFLQFLRSSAILSREEIEILSELIDPTPKEIWSALGSASSSGIYSPETIDLISI
ncbi:hypothetical protein BDF21DRAFT_413521 [Thamnidium elegans]|nr:hypothetical protein BDF21DRAFT_413521 [Thamnidium elegans]